MTVVALTGRLPAFLVACGCLVLLYGFLFSGDYDVNDVTVRGAQLGDPFEIAGTTGAMGVSVFQVEPDKIAERLVALPYVQQVDVETRFPSRVVITLTERQPVLVWDTGVATYLIDGHGQVMTSGAIDGLPVVTSDAREIAPGDAIPVDQVAAVLAIEETVGADIDVIAWNERNGLTVQLDDKRLLILGEPDRFPLKLAVYQEVRTSDIAWSVLDLREPDRPYYE